MTRQRVMILATLTVALGCMGRGSGGAPEETGQVVLYVTSAPSDALCIRITVKGTTTAVASRDLPGDIKLSGLPVGPVVFTAEVFGVACAQVGPETPATYLSDAVSDTLVAGQTANEVLALHTPGGVHVDVTFPDGGAGLGNGASCAAASQCSSGLCIDGVCCSSACTGGCFSCNVPGHAGTCALVPPGQDPRNACSPDPVASCGHDGFCDGMGACRLYTSGTECAPGTCSGGIEHAASTCSGAGTCLTGATHTCSTGACMGNSCSTSSACTGPADCGPGFFCNSGMCALLKSNGVACAAASQCTSGFCTDGVCCGSACDGICQTCNLPGSPGVCGLVPAGQDPSNDCAQDPMGTCGHDGFCNGMGACRFYAAGNDCGSVSCTGSTLTGPGHCDGSGTCAAGTSTSCAPYVCGAGVCKTACAGPTDCMPGQSCVSGLCVAVNGPVLRWRFDEASGTTASDSSGHGLDGIYTGVIGAPTPTTDVPMLPANLRSRAFVRANQQAVRLAVMPAALRPTSDFSLSAWYHATSVDTSGAEIISGGNSYVLRLRSNRIELDKRIAGATYATCYATLASHLDGQWHHLAGVNGAAGLVLYFDGQAVCTNPSAAAVVYDQGPDFWVGRHGNLSASWDFEGVIDDVRVYGRALSAADVATLHQGGEP